jgi:signal transduction histidine kinase
VQDNGIGFNEKYLDRIFRPFERLDATGDFPGIGMGLTICRKIVDNHGGTISAHSSPGKGTTFVVRLPKKQAKERPNNDEDETK